MSILKLKDSQGNWVGVPTVKGDTGNGISSAVLNNDYTLTLTFTDGTTYTTPSIRGEKGERGEPATDMDIHICSASEYDSETRIPIITSPDDKTFYLVPTEDGTSPDLFTEWVYVNNAWEMFGSASMDLSGYLTDVTVGGTSVVTDGVAEIPIGGINRLGVIQTSEGYGIKASNTGVLQTNQAISSEIKNANNKWKPIVPNTQHESTFYGLAKVAGHDEKDSTLPVGQYTDEAKASIQDMLDVPSKSDIPVVNVDDVQINGISIVSNGVANVPIATNGTSTSNGTYGVVKLYGGHGIGLNSGGSLTINASGVPQCKTGTETKYPIVPSVQHASTFYGLAKASGDTTQSASSNAVGNYTDNAKDKIQTMLGVSPLIAPHESDPFESAHVIGELFIINGKLYRAKTALTAGEYINEGTNVEVVNTSDVYVKNTDYADLGKYGLVKLSNLYGIRNYQGALATKLAGNDTLKRGTDQYDPVVASNANVATFYGLAKASGDSTQSQSDNAVGTYTDEAKASIKNMLGVQDNMVVNATLRSGSFYSLDKTYAEIGLAVADGINVVIVSDGKVFPYAGMMYFQSIPVITFGSFFAYEGNLVSNGFIVITDDDDTIAQKIQSETTIPTLNDVQVNGTSIVENGVANMPVANASTLGMVMSWPNGGTRAEDGKIGIYPAQPSAIKNGTATYQPIVPNTQHQSVFYGLAKASGDSTQSASSNVVGTYTDEAKASIQTMLGVPSEDDVVSDVQIDGNSIVTDGVAEIPLGGSSVYGVYKASGVYGVGSTQTHELYITSPTNADIKNGTLIYKPITPSNQHQSVFYGLAKLAGADMSTSSNAIGTYTDEAKTAIKQMLGVHDTIDSFVEEVTGTDVTITGQPSYRYNCGELYSLTVTPPESGTIDIRFTSGSTPTVLTLPQTIKMPEWWVEVEANTIYEMCITDGIYCGVMTWAI